MSTVKEELWRDYQHLSRCEVDQKSCSSEEDSVLLMAGHQRKATKAANCNEEDDVHEVGTDAAEYFSDELPEEGEAQLLGATAAISRPVVSQSTPFQKPSQHTVETSTAYTSRSTPAPSHSPHHSRSQKQMQDVSTVPATQPQPLVSLDPCLPTSVAFEQWMAQWYRPQPAVPIGVQTEAPGPVEVVTSKLETAHLAHKPVTMPIYMSEASSVAQASTRRTPTVKTPAEGHRIAVSSTPQQPVVTAPITREAVKSIQPVSSQVRLKAERSQSEGLKTSNKVNLQQMASVEHVTSRKIQPIVDYSILQEQRLAELEAINRQLRMELESRRPVMAARGDSDNPENEPESISLTSNRSSRTSGRSKAQSEAQSPAHSKASSTKVVKTAKLSNNESEYASDSSTAAKSVSSKQSSKAKANSKGSTSSKTIARGSESEKKSSKKKDGRLHRKSPRKRTVKAQESDTESDDETDGEEVESKHRDVSNRNNHRSSRTPARKRGSVQKYRSASSKSSRESSNSRPRRDSSSSEDEKRPSRKRDERKPRRHRQGGSSPDSSPSSSSDSDKSRDSRDRKSTKKTPVKEIKVDNYSGDSSLEAYLAQFRLAATKNRWPTKDWGVELALRLRGEARNLILPEADSDPPTFKRAVKQLRERFGEPKNPSYHVAQMRARRRKEKETVPELAQWFKKMGLRAYPSERASTRDRILLDTFIRALPDEQQRCYIWDKEPEGLEDAVSAALRYEAIRHTEDQAKAEATARPGEGINRKARAVSAEYEAMRQEMDEVKERLDQETKVKAVIATETNRAQDVGALVQAEVKKAMSSLPPAATSNKPKPTAIQPGQITCYNCGRSGHFVKDCRLGVKCHYCQKLGHLIKDCRKRQYDVNRAGQSGPYSNGYQRNGNQTAPQGNGQGRGPAGATAGQRQ